MKESKDIIGSVSFPESISKAKEILYDSCELVISDFTVEKESQEYEACRFKLNGKNILYRTAKTTPTKTGQFVTVWKRNAKKITEPFNDSDLVDLLIVTVRSDENFGQFFFPKSALIEKGIFSTQVKEGKRAFRVYAFWDLAENKQSQKSKLWQSEYFVNLPDSKMDLSLVKRWIGNDFNYEK